jgi:hypothetical protein
MYGISLGLDIHSSKDVIVQPLVPAAAAVAAATFAAQCPPDMATAHTDIHAGRGTARRSHTPRACTGLK